MDARQLRVKLEELSQEARDQWTSCGTENYRDRIQSCFNCPNWHCFRPIDHEYAWNPCLRTRAKGDSEFTTVKFDFWCPDYAGRKEELNLAWVEAWERAERIEVE